jgi:hypothetical protein
LHGGLCSTACLPTQNRPARHCERLAGDDAHAQQIAVEALDAVEIGDAHRDVAQ